MVRISLLIFSLFFSVLAHANLTASLDRNTIYENETVSLSLILNSSKLFGSPDIDVLKNNFDILSQNKSTQSQWVNGKGGTTTTWHYTLAPKEAGVFTIPSFSVGKESSQALTIQVKRVKNPGGSPNDILFMEFEADKTQAKVQEQIRLTLRIHYATHVSNLSLEALEISNARVIDGQESQYRRSMGGRNYDIYEKTYFVFPEQSGKLTIPQLSAELLIPRTNTDMMFGTGSRQILRSQAIHIDVEPASNQLINADSLHIEESWSADPQSLQVGDSINRTITQKAQGALAEQLNDIHMPQHEAMRIYSESPQFNNHISQHGNTGIRTDSMAIVATQPGKVTFPEVQIAWFNNQTQQQEVATLPAIELVITGDMPVVDNSAQSTPSSIQNDASRDTESNDQVVSDIIASTEKTTPWQSIFWPISTLFCLLVIAILSIKLFKQSPSTEESIEAKPQVTELAWREFKKACAGSNASEVRAALLRWAKLHWPNQAVYALADVQRLAGSNDVKKELERLDKALYQGQAESSYMGLLEALEQQQGEEEKSSIYPTR